MLAAVWIYLARSRATAATSDEFFGSDAGLSASTITGPRPPSPATPHARSSRAYRVLRFALRGDSWVSRFDPV